MRRWFPHAGDVTRYSSERASRVLRVAVILRRTARANEHRHARIAVRPRRVAHLHHLVSVLVNADGTSDRGRANHVAFGERAETGSGRIEVREVVERTVPPDDLRIGAVPAAVDLVAARVVRGDLEPHEELDLVAVGRRVV